MTECPVVMIDYTSALVGADWYEEMGHSSISEEVRHLTRPPMEVWEIKNMRSGIRKQSWSHSSWGPKCGSSSISKTTRSGNSLNASINEKLRRSLCRSRTKVKHS